VKTSNSRIGWCPVSVIITRSMASSNWTGSQSVYLTGDGQLAIPRRDSASVRWVKEE
jgi:hypothetical protein